MSIADKLIEIANNSPMVYDAGYEDGHSVGFDEAYDVGYGDGYSAGEEAGIAAGKQAEYDRFWDAYQEKGARTSYNYAFYGWTDEIFNPKYAIIGDQLQGAFMYFTGTEINVDIDARNATSMNSCFNRCTNLRKIQKLIVGENTTFHVAMFSYSTNIEELYFEGVIAMSLAMNSSAKLTHDSIMSAVNNLKDYSGSETAYTLSLGTANLAKLTDAEKAIATEKGWTLA